ncbi:unnamed protein product [Polarella glacialis]|uniref:PPPDE domain-containing protein n=1 Tax=Polarella glacialis TaxID=89957 RepID=A0A813D9E7_POLGL|nr:unnamed protein product [Polarella glacialis]
MRTQDERSSEIGRAFACTAAQESTEAVDESVPPARTAPRGLAGLFDGSGGPASNYAPLDTTSLPQNTVLINVYDLGDEDVFQRINRFSTINDRVLVGGVYHAGVEIYGYEWSYGFTDQPNSGVFPSPPRCVGQHTYRATVVLGQSMLSAREVNDALAYLKQRWQGMDYHLLHKNCLDFANALCIELGVGRMPGWIDRYARTGASLDNFRNAASERIDQTKDLVRAISLDVDNTLKGFGEEAVPKFAEAVQVKAEAMSQGLSRWGTDLFGAMTRAIGNEKQPNRQQKGCSLRDALRNRGGVRLEQASPPCAADPVKEAVAATSGSEAKRPLASSTARAPVEDAFLLDDPHAPSLAALEAPKGAAEAVSEGQPPSAGRTASPDPGWTLLG